MAYLITDPDFITADNLDESKYKDVTMGKKEGEVMKDLIYKHGFFRRTESIDFQGVCSISPYAPPVSNSSLVMLSDRLLLSIAT
jgi:voltage-dependent calcium channel alpha-2/delta-3